MALDRSLRSIDADGHMVVEMSRISKANICPYRGSEIPNFEALGLEPDRIYHLYRDPKEFENGTRVIDGKEVRVGAWSADGKPLVIKHKAITSEVPEQSLWVGTVGACTFEAPYLIARPLTVITAEAQALIDDEDELGRPQQRELSAGYRYRADMTPGTTPDGERYDGAMRDLAFNHVALVAAGRAGPDVHVADELPLELKSMKHGKRIARLQKRIPALAALSSADLLALDAELGETPAKSVVTLDEAEEKAATDEALAEKRKTEGEDAELTAEERESAIQKARDKKAKDSKAKDEKEDESEEEAEDESEEEEEAEDEKEDDEPKKAAKDKKAKDADPDHRKDFNSIKQGKDKRGKDKALDSMTMDQVNVIVEKAVARATKATADKVREEVTAKQRALAIACDEVTPLVGKVQLHAFDSAEEVYAFALEKVGVDIDDDFPEAGYRALVKNELRHRETTRKPVKHALDHNAGGFDADALFQKVN